MRRPRAVMKLGKHVACEMGATLPILCFVNVACNWHAPHLINRMLAVQIRSLLPLPFELAL